MLVVDLLIGVAVLALLIYNQLRVRQVSGRSTRLAVILAVIGLVQTAQYLEHRRIGTGIVLALAGSLVLAAGFGAARAATVKIWLRDGQALSQGNWLTALLWVVALAAHLGYDAVTSGHGNLAASFSGNTLGAATTVLYLAVSLGVQRLIVQHRAQRLQPSQDQAWTPV
jgi:hypothetical protein